MRARFAVDFDGTLVEDDKYPEIGEWIPGAAEFVYALCRIGQVVIYTCRVSPAHHITEEPRSEYDVALEIARIRDKLGEKGLQDLEIWTKPYKPPAVAYIDNRGVHADGDFDGMLERVLDIIAPTGDRGPLEAEDIRYVEPQERYGVCCGDCDRCPVEEKAVTESFLARSSGPTWIPMRPEKVAPCEDTRCPCETGTECSFDAADVVFTAPSFPDGFVWSEEEGRPVYDPFWAAMYKHPERHPLSKRFHEILDELGVLHDQKQKDYGTDGDPFANVRASEDFGIPGWVGVAIRMNDKMKRIQRASDNFIKTGDAALFNESLVDSFNDLAVYAAIGRVLLEEQS